MINVVKTSLSNKERYYKGTREDIVNFLPDKYSKILEIGCGRGGFRANLSNKCEYWGIEAVDKLDNI